MNVNKVFDSYLGGVCYSENLKRIFRYSEAMCLEFVMCAVTVVSWLCVSLFVHHLDPSPLSTHSMIAPRCFLSPCTFYFSPSVHPVILPVVHPVVILSVTSHLCCQHFWKLVWVHSLSSLSHSLFSLSLPLSTSVYLSLEGFSVQLCFFCFQPPLVVVCVWVHRT